MPIDINAFGAVLNKNERSGTPIANDLIEQILATYEAAKEAQPPVRMIGATCVCGRQMTVTGNVVTDQPDDCREAFEDWAMYKDLPLIQYPDGDIRQGYINESTRWAWIAWSERLPKRESNKEEDGMIHLCNLFKAKLLEHGKWFRYSTYIKRVGDEITLVGSQLEQTNTPPTNEIEGGK